MVTTSKDHGLRPMPVLNHLNVRHARTEDAATIASFSAAMALETEGRRLDLDRLYDGTIALLESPDRGFFMVAELEQADDRQLLGQLMITYEWSDWRNGAFWWIQSVYVDPVWRRQSVFRRMHETIMATAKTSPNVCGVRLYVDKDNMIAHTTYERLGLIRSAYQVYESDFVLPPQTAKE
jgi:GNAT superfamily N-acetyltransferase